MLLFENQDAGSEMRVEACEMQRGGESAWAAAEDENVMLGIHKIESLNYSPILQWI